ncbi:hypothetical protein B4135_0550 [Caldibacillus debilis]|uniref:Uncharacterized protein n=1 Tax=Caldibacillus debilis TaxID=301148 RepID=A0A150MA59_9BACI|nr:hypothetical protein B4135_0550 [Caldibacillus debilis]
MIAAGRSTLGHGPFPFLPGTVGLQQDPCGFWPCEPPPFLLSVSHSIQYEPPLFLSSGADSSQYPWRPGRKR